MAELVDLVERARRGDPEAFSALIDRRQEALTRVAMAILGNPTDAADALQDALAAMWRALPALREAERFAAWSDRILVNSCRLVLRRRGRRQVRELALDSAAVERRPALQPAFDEALARRQAIERAFERLSVDDRAVLVLHHLEERAVADIADVLGIPIGTVKSRLHRARGALERAMALEFR